MKNVLIAGGSGFIGRKLTNLLIEKEYKVSWLTRKINSKIDIPQFEWDVNDNKIDIVSLNNINTVINLTGENIDNKRWSVDFKKLIYESRVKSAELLVKSILSNNENKVETFINASGVGYYGNTTSDKIYNETDLPGSDFLAKTCNDAENQLIKLNDSGIKVVIIRTAIAIDAKSPAYKKMALPVKLGLGTALGTGKQYFPWISSNDLCQIYLTAIENKNFIGIYNAATPNHQTQRQVIEKIALQYKKKLFLPNLPAFAARLLFGEISEYILNGSRISCDKLLNTGFKFKYAEFENAINDL